MEPEQVASSVVGANRRTQRFVGMQIEGVVDDCAALGKGEVAVAQDETGFLVIKLLEIERPATSEKPEVLSTIEERLAAEMNDDLLSSFSLALRQTYDVSVNGSLIEEVLTRY